MAFCKTCGTQIPDGTNQCADCQAAQATPAPTPNFSENTSAFAPGSAPVGDPVSVPVGGGFDAGGVFGAAPENDGNSKKGFVILGILAVIIIAAVVAFVNIFGGGCKKPIKTAVKSINKVDVDKAFHAIIPKKYFKDFKEAVEDNTGDDYKDAVKDLEDEINDAIKDSKIKYKVKVDFKGKKKVSNSDLDDIQDMVDEFTDELDLDDLEVKSAYRVKVKLSTELKYKKESASAGFTFNIYVVKYKGCSGWYLAPYSDEKSMGDWVNLADDFDDLSYLKYFF